MNRVTRSAPRRRVAAAGAAGALVLARGVGRAPRAASARAAAGGGGGRGGADGASRDVATVERELASLRDRHAAAVAAVETAAEEYAAAQGELEAADAEVRAAPPGLSR